MTSDSRPPIVLNLSPTASKFLDTVVELSHLDDAMLESVNSTLLNEPGQDGTIELATVKRVVATVLSDKMPDLPADRVAVLIKEWPALFG